MTSWFKGNTHCHSTESDGDANPETVIRWYRDHGYNFLALSDHDVLVDPSRYRHIETPEFILVAGEEVTDALPGVPLHTHALGNNRKVTAQRGESLVGVLQADVDAVHEAGGIAIINHPNFHYAISSVDIAALRGVGLFELYNAHPESRNLGDPALDKPSMEAIWDEVLTGGMRMYGLASDDAHHYSVFSPAMANPGRAWVMVRAEVLTPAAILAALDAGDFYASTGVTLLDLVNTPDHVALDVKAEPGISYRIDFIASGGEVAQSSNSVSASFKPVPDHSYIRARVMASDGSVCWIQPVFPK